MRVIAKKGKKSQTSRVEAALARSAKVVPDLGKGSAGHLLARMLEEPDDELCGSVDGARVGAVQELLDEPVEPRGPAALSECRDLFRAPACLRRCCCRGSLAVTHSIQHFWGEKRKENKKHLKFSFVWFRKIVVLFTRVLRLLLAEQHRQRRERSVQEREEGSQR